MQRPIATSGYVGPSEAADAEHLALEAAVEQARQDPQPSICHDEVRNDLMKMADLARRKVALLAGRRLAG